MAQLKITKPELIGLAFGNPELARNVVRTEQSIFLKYALAGPNFSPSLDHVAVKNILEIAQRHGSLSSYIRETGSVEIRAPYLELAKQNEMLFAVALEIAQIRSVSAEGLALGNPSIARYVTYANGLPIGRFKIFRKIECAYTAPVKVIEPVSVAAMLIANRENLPIRSTSNTFFVEPVPALPVDVANLQLLALILEARILASGYTRT